ncbi:MAG: methylated-DNA--[protein]-cysteine S-methyltransferase [Bacteroidota bacterium]
MPNDQHYHRIAKAIRFVSSNTREQPTLAEIAAHVHLSKFHFQRLFQEWAGVSPKQFLRYLTLEHAKERLLAGQATLHTAYEVGLSGNGRLHDLFIQLQGCSPGAWKQRGQGLNIRYAVVPSPFGDTLVAETAKGICRLAFIEANQDPVGILKSDFPYANLQASNGPHIQAVAAYFSTWVLPQTPIPLDLKGTPFQLSVWRALLDIPPGTLRSYGQVASVIGKPAASRAVGTAIGKNPIAYLIPCHRVLRESGQLGGYRWGTDRKLAINGYEAARY